MKILICNSKNWFRLDKTNLSHIDFEQISKKEELNLKFLDSIMPKYIFFVHWNWFVSEEVFNKYECILFHTSPLPYGRGGSPIQNLILNGFTKSPVCALRMNQELDVGPIYLKKNVSLKGSLSQIFVRINKVINIFIIKITKEEIIPKEQKGKIFNFTRLSKKDNKLPEDLNLKELFDRIRMIDDKDYPNAFLHYGNLKFEFSNATLKNNEIIVTCKISK